MAEERVSRIKYEYEKLKKDRLCNKSYEDWKEKQIARGPYATIGDDPKRALLRCISSLRKSVK